MSSNGNIDKLIEAGRALRSKLVTYSTFIIGITILVALIIWGTNKMTLDSRNCTTMMTYYDNAGTQITNTNFDSTVPQPSDATGNPALLKNYSLCSFNILTAYNCCCAGNFKNDFVNLCALQNCIRQGARCLDVEVYSVNNDPVIATSSVDDDSIKETYNSVPFADMLDTVAKYAFTSGMKYSAPNPNDPLILNIRMMSKNKKIYNKMAKNIEDSLGDHLLPPQYSYNYKNQNIGQLPISTFNGSDKKEANVLIYMDIDLNSDIATTLPETKLFEMVNLVGNMPSPLPKTKNPSDPKLESNTFYTISAIHDIKNGNSSTIQNKNKTTTTMCVPDLAETAVNPDFTIAKDDGCQMIAMCFQTQDANLQSCLDFFNNQGCAFVLKEDSLLPTYTYVKKPAPMKESHKFVKRTVEIPGHPGVSFTV